MNVDTKPYILPVVFSVALHVGIVLLTLVSWPSLSKPEPIAPHMQARVIDQEMLNQLIKSSDPIPTPVQKVQPVPTKTEPSPKPEVELEKIEQKKQADKQKEALKKKQQAEVKRRKEEAIALKQKKLEEEKKKRIELEREKKRLAAEKEKEKLRQEKVLADKKKEQEAEEKRLAEKKRQEQEKLAEQKLAEQKKIDIENRLKEEREKARLERIKEEEHALRQQAAQFEQALLAKAEAQDSANRRQRELSELEKFTVQIKNAVERAWILPPGDSSGLRATLNLRLAPSGDLIEAKITESSGNRAYDISLKSAAYSVKRYPVTKDSRLFDSEFRNMYLNFITE